MKVKLPFVVQPKYPPKKVLIGSEVSGQFEIERRGYLSVQEKSFVQMAMREMGNSAMMKVVRSIAKAEGKKQQQIIDDLQSYKPGEVESYLDNYGDELLELSQEMEQSSSMQKMAQSTALLMSRHDSSWEFNDTLELHPDLVDDLAKLYLEEDLKSVKDLVDESEDETLSKSKEEDGKVSKEKAKTS